MDLTLFKDKTFTGATLSNFLLNGAAGTLIVALALVQQAAGLSTLQSGLLTVGYLVAVLSTIRVGEKLLQKMGARKPMLYGCLITAFGILLTCCTFLLAQTYMIVAFIGFTLFGIGLGFYATPSTDAALSNVPQAKAGSASGLYKMASSLGAALGVAISAALFTRTERLDFASTVLRALPRQNGQCHDPFRRSSWAALQCCLGRHRSNRRRDHRPEGRSKRNEILTRNISELDR